MVIETFVGYLSGQIDARVYVVGPVGHHDVAVPRARSSTLAGPRTRHRPQQSDPDSRPLEHRADHLRGIPPSLSGPDLR